MSDNTSTMTGGVNQLNGQKQAPLIEKMEECRKKGTSIEMKNLAADMHPAVQYGDLLGIRPCTSEELNEGDIFFYRSGSTVKLRRFIKRQYQYHEMYVIAKADSEKTPNEPIKPTLVIGKVVSISRNGKPVGIKDEGFIRKLLAGLGLLSFSS